MAALIMTLLMAGCSDVRVAHYETVDEARAAGLFQRGWVPDVIPGGATALLEAHDTDTNARCAQASLPAHAAGGVVRSLSLGGFEPFPGPLPPPRLKQCPFTTGDLTGPTTQLYRERAGDLLEIAVVTENGGFYYWTS